MKKDLSRVLTERQMLSSLRSAIADAIEPSSATRAKPLPVKLPKTALIENEPGEGIIKPGATQQGLSPSAPSEIVIRT